MEKMFRSDISGRTFPLSERIRGGSIRESIRALIQRDHPGFADDSQLAVEELNRYRERYISEYLTRQLGELTALEKTVLDTMQAKVTISDKVDLDEDMPLTIGQRLADRVASFGGSWTFIIAFGSFLFAWVVVNAWYLHDRGFDPYPFILLNLILSCIAALQAPVIMMSQNRQEQKDRDRARKDYMVNLRAELEIRALHEKIDHLIMHQQQELLEIQKVQIEMMNDILLQVKRS